MRMRELEAFRATILYGTMSSAAEMLRTSQPTVSRLLSDLEYSLGFALFTRRKGKVVPTDEGMAFYQRLDEVFGAFTRLHSAASDIRRDRNNTVRIISLPALSMTIVPEIIERFARQRPEVSVSLTTVDIPSFFNMVREADTDIGFANQLGTQPTIQQTVLAEIDFVCAVPADHRLADRSSIDIADLAGENVISLSEKTQDMFQAHRVLLETLGDRISQNYATQNSANAYALVAKGLGVAILEPFSAALWQGQGVVVRPFSPRLTYRYSASVNASMTASDPVRAIMGIAREVFGRFDSRKGRRG